MNYYLQLHALTIHVRRLHHLQRQLVSLSHKPGLFPYSVRNYSVFSRNNPCMCCHMRKRLKTHKTRSWLYEASLRYAHDDTREKSETGLDIKELDDSEDATEADTLRDVYSVVSKRKTRTVMRKTDSNVSGRRDSFENVSGADLYETEIEEADKDIEHDPDERQRPDNGNGKSETDIKKFMTDMELGHVTGYTNYFTVCPKLGKMAMKKKRKEDRLYINSTSGYFYCRHCGKSGTWSQLQDNIAYIKSKKANRHVECFKDITDVERETDVVHPGVLKQLDGAHDFTTLTDEMFDTIQSIFEWHGIEKKTFIDYGVKYKTEDNEFWIIFPANSPVSGVVSSVSVHSGKITEDGDIKIKPVQRYPRGEKLAHLFGWQNQANMKVATQNSLVITTSEADAMTVSQATGILSLSLKNISQLPQESLPFFEDFSKIILWLGTDVKAWDNTKIFAKKLGDKRCYVFRPTVLKSMPLEVIQKGDKIGSILSMSKLISHKAIVTFANVRQEVYSEFADFQQVAGVKWKRYTKLNTLLKGHRRGELTILTGPTGSGKTTFMSEYSLDLCMQGVNTLWGSFEISNVRLIKVMMQQFCGKSIPKHLDEFDEIADEFSSLPMYFMMYYGQEQVKNVLEAMSHAVYIHDIGHVIVDNLQFMMGMDYTERNRFFKQDQIVSSFRKFATEKNCHVTLIIHPRKVNESEELSTASVFGSAKVTQEADNILLIQDQRLTKSSGRKYVQYVAQYQSRPTSFYHGWYLRFVQQTALSLKSRSAVRTG
ncbi:twinkle mtDNA helicase-like isoform X2 [Mercenaria mercenaria]|uniref:twinkle mtDNA helicase-like isoform X2 n=1 Tax=Mercenaria mercenaria TaxID=6596 RepID=UPI00234EFDE5|nr:twinkle mtDNA helicase-like isoform X2 [Mercenaria mercenaria]